MAAEHHSYGHAPVIEEDFGHMGFEEYDEELDYEDEGEYGDEYGDEIMMYQDGIPMDDIENARYRGKHRRGHGRRHRRADAHRYPHKTH